MAFASFDNMNNALTASSGEPLPDGAASSTAPGRSPDSSSLITGQAPLGWPPAAPSGAQFSFANSAHPVATAPGGDAEWVAAGTAGPAGGAVGVGARRTGVTKFFNVLKVSASSRRSLKSSIESTFETMDDLWNESRYSGADPETGSLNFRKGFGFILDHRADELGGDEVFVHYSAIEAVQSGTGGFRSLQEGELVEYNIVRSGKGFQAQNVTGPDARDGARRQSTSGASHQSHRSMQPRGHFSRSSVHYVGPQYFLPVQDPYLVNIGGYGGPASTRPPPHGDRLVGAAGMAAPPFKVGAHSYRFVEVPRPHPSSHHQPGGPDPQMILAQTGAGHGHDYGYGPAPPFYYTSFPAQYEVSSAAPPGGAMAYYPLNAHTGGVAMPGGPTPTHVPASFGVAKTGGGGGGVGSSDEMDPPGGGGGGGGNGTAAGGSSPVVTGYIYPIGPGTAYAPSPPPSQSFQPQPISSRNGTTESLDSAPDSSAVPPPATTCDTVSKPSNEASAAAVAA
ncbi:BZ3500_MvSof-1268-A1-R1_Chr1-2g01430 [Microbotryum saponariae]|uniref:BZ3500_MvSof-1268-A1-R1_Chr1-2g01430 protein n=1 Tax=Microbotryum saponariae TaxID=289078 RepID=A0A2X0KEL7_9BASI|nr:BZ3500_MvSof-1268-A1-R1_Chr1-2g01430 [Microbotryum saponariae]SCZ97414.1 BZ3501_MvSof-1269-A2-R1_Chr1-2g01029 [Microbotryum saponariae]